MRDDGQQGRAGGGPGGQSRNGIAQAVTSVGRLVDASEYGGQASGQLYDLQGTAAALFAMASS